MSTNSTTTKGFVLALAYLGFISLGLPDGLHGVGWPSVSVDFGVPLASVGLLITAGTIGYVISSVAAGFTIARLGVGWLLAASTALASLALFGYAASPRLAFMVGCALLLGLGSGAIDSGLNAYAAANFNARHMNWLHASFGFGATLGPLIMTGVLGAGLAWRWGYGTVAAAQGTLAVAFLLTARHWAAHRAGSETTGPAAGAGPGAGAVAKGARPEKIPIRRTLAIPAVWLGATAFAVYVGLEIGVGLWAFTLLTQGRGLGDAVAGVCVSVYWGSLFVGRLALGAMGDRIGTHQVLTYSLSGLVVGCVLIAVPGAAWLTVAGLLIVGASAAAVFPLLTLTTADRVGVQHADRAIGVQMGLCAVGGAVLPALMGVLVTEFDVNLLGPCLVVLAVTLMVLYLASRRTSVTAG